MLLSRLSSFFFFFNDTATTEIYTLSLHDALPISRQLIELARDEVAAPASQRPVDLVNQGCLSDRKSTRLNSSHGYISYAVFCLKKKKSRNEPTHRSTCPNAARTYDSYLAAYRIKG